MLTWEENYFAGVGVQEPELIRKKIQEGKDVPGIYLLTLPRNPENVMEILPAVNLNQYSSRELCPKIFGIARGKEEALELSRRILMESYRKTGSFQIQEYLKNR